MPQMGPQRVKNPKKSKKKKKRERDDIEAYRRMAMFQINLSTSDKTEIHAVLSYANTCPFNGWALLTSRHTVGF